MTKTNNEWVEVAERIVIDYANLSGRDIQHRAEFRERVDKHLQNLLSSERQRVRERIAEMKKGRSTTNWCNDCNGYIDNAHHQMTCKNYNQALSDILKLLEE